MSVRYLINKEKLRCDNIISIILVLIMGGFFLFFRLIMFVSLIVYPLSSVFLYGIYYVSKSLASKDRNLTTRVLRLIQGVVYLTFSTLVLLVIFSYPHITLDYAIFFLSIPVFLIGLAAILKGSIVQVYSPNYRRLNILIGFLTLYITFLALLYAEAYFILSLFSLLFLLTLNGILRSGLYLSEYGLSIRNLKNIKLVFYLMDNLIVINPEEDVQY